MRWSVWQTVRQTESTSVRNYDTLLTVYFDKLLKEILVTWRN